MLTVSFTVSGQRPYYLRRTLDSWAKVRGISDARVVFALEPTAPGFEMEAFSSWVSTFPAAEMWVEVAREQLGCDRNTHRAVGLGLERSNFTVLAEEDIEVADDTLEYFSWASETYREDAKVLAVCAHVKEPGGGADGVTRAAWFSPLVWGTWSDRWANLLAEPWRILADGSEDAVHWDGLVRSVRLVGEYDCVFPVRSRSWHFGERSTLAPDRVDGAPNYFHLAALTSCFQPHYEPQAYREVQAPGIVLY